MNVVARQIIRTGHPVSDDQALEQMRAHAAMQGCELQVERLPQGGYQVDVVRTPSPFQPQQPPPYGAPPPQQAMQVYAPPQMQAYQQPQPQQQAWGSPDGQMYGQPPTAFAPASGRCRSCGREAQTKQVTFHQNVGVLIMRFPKSVTGQLCRDCIGDYFWRFSTISFFFGWWGVISFFYTLVTLPMNVITYLGALDLPRPHPQRV